MKRRVRKWFEAVFGRAALRVILLCSRGMDSRSIEKWGRRCGDLIYLLSRRYRTVALTNLRWAFPDWEKPRLRAVARQTFRNFAITTLEFFHSLHESGEELDRMMDVEGFEHLEQASALGKGVILITAHLGNWEMSARWLVRRGYKLSVVARRADDPFATDLMNAVRTKGGYTVLDREGSALPMLRCLKRGEVLAILPDQNTAGTLFVDFFGRPAATAEGPAMLAIRTGAPIVCAFSPHAPGARVSCHVLPALVLKLTGDEVADVRTVTAQITKAIEDEVRRDPAQWLWLHDRWRRTGEAPQERGA